MAHKSIIGKLFFAPRTICRKLYPEVDRAYQHWLHRRAEKRSAKKDVLNVVFFVVFHSSWKLESVYKAMLADKRFNPIILICPVMNYGWQNMLDRMQADDTYFKERNYPNVYCAYNEQTKKYINVRKEFKPDIIFYTNPYEGLIDDRYYITKFRDVLTCYVDYGFNNLTGKFAYDMPFHNMLWQFYLENEEIRLFFNTKLGYKRANHLVTGYPSFDAFNRKCEGKNLKYKYIIWAPHHSIDAVFGIIHRNSFEYYYQIMLDLAEKYKDKVFFIFRPHPLLKNKLYERNDWGRNRTDAYYAKWSSLPNAILSETRDYVDDFVLSDAIIHDCGSFSVEYLFTEKPALFTGSHPAPDALTPTAYKAFDCYQYASSSEEIEQFIIDVVAGKEDLLKEMKHQYKQNYLLPPNGCSVAENMINAIVDRIKC